MLKLQDDKLYDADKNATKLHTQFRYVKNYCTDEKIAQWKKDHVSTANRWVEIFKHLDKNDCEYTEMAKIIEYILCLPGTTASVERIFADVNKTWTPEKRVWVSKH